MFCRTCGKQIDNDSIYCRYCGSYTKLPEIITVSPEEKANGWIIFLSVLLPPVGIILGLRYRKNGRIKPGTTYLGVGIFSTVIILYVICALLIFYCIIEFFHFFSDNMFHGGRRTEINWW